MFWCCPIRNLYVIYFLIPLRKYCWISGRERISCSDKMATRLDVDTLVAGMADWGCLGQCTLIWLADERRCKFKQESHSKTTLNGWSCNQICPSSCADNLRCPEICQKKLFLQDKMMQSSQMNVTEALDVTLFVTYIFYSIVYIFYWNYPAIAKGEI